MAGPLGNSLIQSLEDIAIRHQILFCVAECYGSRTRALPLLGSVVECRLALNAHLMLPSFQIRTLPAAAPGTALSPLAR